VCRAFVMPQALTPVLNKKAFEGASVRTRTQLAEVALETALKRRRMKLGRLIFRIPTGPSPQVARRHTATLPES
jgi:hypothetical protein